MENLMKIEPKISASVKAAQSIIATKSMSFAQKFSLNPIRLSHLGCIAGGVGGLAFMTLAQTSVFSPSVPLDVGAKGAARIYAGPSLDQRQLAFYPEDLALEASLRSFQPIKQWALPVVQEIAQQQAPIPEKLSQPANEKQAGLVARPFILLPPERPLSLMAANAATKKPSGSTPQKKAEEKESRLTLAGMELPRFVPTGAEIMQRIGGIGDSIGKMIKLSAR